MSASFLDRFAPIDAAVDRWWRFALRSSSEKPESGRWRLGLGRTSGLRQKAKPETFRECCDLLAGAHMAADVDFLHPGDDPDEIPLGIGDSSSSALGDMPRSVARHDLRPPTPLPSSSREKSRDFFFRKAENQEEDVEAIGAVGSRSASSDLEWWPPKREEKTEKRLFFLGKVLVGPTCGVL